MFNYIAVHDHEYGQTVCRFSMPDPLDLTANEDVDKILAEALDLDYDPDSDSLTIVADDVEVRHLSQGVADRINKAQL